MKRVVCVFTLAALALGIALALAACGAQDITPPIQDIDLARDQAARSEIILVKSAIATYVATNGALPAAATKQALGSATDAWPANPWTGAPMAPGDKKGDIVYSPGAGASYTLGVHLSDGTVYTAP
jgi:hypothetical protein